MAKIKKTNKIISNKSMKFTNVLKKYGVDEFTKETNNNLKMKNINIIEYKYYLIKKIERALSNKDKQTNFTIGALNEYIKIKIEKELDLKLFKNNQYILILNDDDIKHIKKHFDSSSQIAEEILRLFDIISNYDNVSYIKHNTENRLIFEKDYLYTKIRAILIVSNKNNALDLVSIYYIKKRNQLNHSATSKSSFELESTS